MIRDLLNHLVERSGIREGDAVRQTIAPMQEETGGDEPEEPQRRSGRRGL